MVDVLEEAAERPLDLIISADVLVGGVRGGGGGGR